jgi:serine/threonine protein kinase
VKHVCTRCERSSEDGNLWCQELDCPAEEMPVVFGYGQVIGDIKILRLLKVLRTSALYDAERGGLRVLLKVAHLGCEDRLRMEADLLRQLQGTSKRPAHPCLPYLLSAYQQSSIQRHAYGKAVVEDQAVYFEVFEYIDALNLRETLNESPQPWYEHAAWITLSIGRALEFLHSRAKRLHLMVSPETILIRTDKEGVARPILIDLGLLIAETHMEDLQWLHNWALPAYTAPELTYTTPDTVDRCLPATPGSDVYGLGLLLYEMLAGYPVFDYRRQRESDVRESVRSHSPRALTRRDLPDEIHVVIERAISKSPRDRYPDIGTFMQNLRRYFGDVPAEKTPRPAGQRLLIGATALAFVLAVIILLVAFMGS